MKYNMLDYYREILNSDKSYAIDYKNLSKQLILIIDNAIEYIKQIETNENKQDGNYYSLEELLEILGDKE